jgi:hypothetical protein
MDREMALRILEIYWIDHYEISPRSRFGTALQLVALSNTFVLLRNYGIVASPEFLSVEAKIQSICSLVSKTLPSQRD